MPRSHSPFFQSKPIGTKEGRRVFSGNLLIALLSGVVAVFVPSVGWPWFHLFVYPLVFILALAIVLAPVILVTPLVFALRAAAARARLIKCTSNLKQVGLGARLWANDHDDILPKDFASMKNELGTEDITFCPSDKTVQYDILSPGVSEIDPCIVYARCPVHNNVVLADGTAHQLGKRQLAPQNGKWTINSTSSNGGTK
jgi:hypothetical protein